MYRVKRNMPRKKRPSKKDLQAAMTKTNDAYHARTGKTMGKAGRDTRAENNAERYDYKALERRHSGTAIARDVAVAQCAEKAEGRRWAETLAEERKNQLKTRNARGLRQQQSQKRSTSRG